METAEDSTEAYHFEKKKNGQKAHFYSQNAKSADSVVIATTYHYYKYYISIIMIKKYASASIYIYISVYINKERQKMNRFIIGEAYYTETSGIAKIPRKADVLKN
jgi:hypothetical protein